MRALHIFETILWIGLALWVVALPLAAVPFTGAALELRKKRDSAATFLIGFMVLAVDSFCILTWILIRRNFNTAPAWLDEALLYAIGLQLAVVPVVVIAVAVNNYRRARR